MEFIQHLSRHSRYPTAIGNQRLYELDSDCRELPPNKTEQFTLIEIIAFKGRSVEAKKSLYQAIVRNLNMAPGISGDDIMIIIHEPPLENWGIRGGKPANEVDLGFDIEI